MIVRLGIGSFFEIWLQIGAICRVNKSFADYYDCLVVDPWVSRSYVSAFSEDCALKNNCHTQ